MRITEISVKRPAAVIMAVVLILALGILGYRNLGADLMPTTDTPVITIMTTYQGAGVEEIEQDIIKPVENEIAGLSGIDTIRSTAVTGLGYTTIMFTMETDINQAFMDVQQAIADVSVKLPPDASKPTIRKFDKNSQPVMMLAITGEVPYEELYAQADALKSSLEKLPGVGSVNLEGAYQKELAIQVNKEALDLYGININTIVSRLQQENLNAPAGEIKQDVQSQTVRVDGEFGNISEIEDLRITTPAGEQVRLCDVADVALQYPDQDEIRRLNQTQSIGVFIQKQSDANIVETTDTVKENLEVMQKGLTQGVSVTIASDKSEFIHATLKSVLKSLLEGIVTTSFVLLLFLRKWRSALIVLVAIPTSLIATFFMMYVLDFTLNIMSLLALSASIGILVDDSIVVLENIQRHLKMGKNPITAAIEGRKEIGMAAIAITLSDVVVFAPVAFMSGMIGRYFREFGLTIVCATLFSLLVSFTLTPMLSAKLLKKDTPSEENNTRNGSDELISNPWQRLLLRFSNIRNIRLLKKLWSLNFSMDRLTDQYKRGLVWCLDNQKKVVVLVGIALFVSILLIPAKVINTEFIPKTDQSSLTIDLSLTPGVNLKQTDQKVQRVEAYLQTLPEVSDYFSRVGVDEIESSAEIMVNLVPISERKKSQEQVAEEIRSWGPELEGVVLSVTEASLVGRTSMDGTKPVVINITGPDPEVLKQIAGQVENTVQAVAGTTDISNSIQAGQKDFSVEMDRLAAAEYGITASDAANTLRTAIQGTEAGVYRKNGNEYDMIVKFQDGQITTKEDLENIRIVSASGQQVALSQVASVNLTGSPQELLRLNRQELVSVSANIQGRSLGSINQDIKEKLKTLPLPAGYSIAFGGDQENMAESFSSIGKALLASIILVYMILVVLYESYLTPFIRMLSLPCGMIGALLALALTGTTLNLVTMIALIMLDGLASKNGTLLIDYTNTLRKRGLPLREALIESGATRLKPILMTTITIIVGMLPVALAMGEGSEIKSGMGIVLIGGMLTSTLLSPFLLPVVYVLLDDVKKKIASRRNSAAKNSRDTL